MTTKTCGCTAKTCGCCEGIQALTPQSTINRPGLSALKYRVGTHGAFLETMKARLSTMTVDVLAADGQTIESFTPLRDLTTRDSGDFSIALLDAWATVADVLTFYQERIADESYLRTASERRSILELARLVGYTLRPGVAATVYLAYTIDEDRSVTPPKPIATTIPKGSRSQSVPGPDELPQSFETADDLEARSTWNVLKPRMTRPQTQTKDSIKTSGLFLSGIATNLQPNDPLLIDFGKTGEAPTLYRVKQIVTDAANNRTHVTLQSRDGSQTEVSRKRWRAGRDFEYAGTSAFDSAAQRAAACAQSEGDVHCERGRIPAIAGGDAAAVERVALSRVAKRRGDCSAADQGLCAAGKVSAIWQ